MNMPTIQELTQIGEVIIIWIKYMLMHLAVAMPIMFIVMKFLNVNKKFAKLLK
ncbi:hypothetical protein CLL_0021 (plasmid) [Clostridium botulinum B str. Eklund 17B (NRP)]|uniref:Uncharacterized protein n=3 Tax=Clostridium botulinum TaxID=1491 RepID=A0A0A0UX63_CLOBO|nr:hypothetical protein [Clostridium botulinum]ACD14181.1 hypothetical protein CLL_0021 [Clostridium botulinum B str. Eklund 17B (NRP)]AIW54506.1 hypothetical protein [Clostridium botulinum]AIW54560.1 hypothetical protein [Clostridium botulinum]MBY6977834.1 hypothetical protein [Clostridium botulinum]MBY7002345.1 hypothetical protein [Clostridium botulinum]